MTHPYEKLNPSAFWRTGVGERNPLAIRDVWNPKFEIRPEDPLSTAGSCFAQHIGRALVAKGYTWFDAEPAPSFLDQAARERFNYGIFSFRTSNIYTAAMLRQWVEWALEISNPPAEIWEENARYFDPFRPAIEPAGFESEEELLSSRAVTLKAVRRALECSSVFTFTLGLTEAWINRRDGYVYAACPGTLHGSFDAERHAFRNFTQSQVLADLTTSFDLIRELNSDLRILLTVSPVPLTATASGKHVLVSNTYSKSVLRSVAGEFVEGRNDADYFPSYELISTPPFRGMFYDPNLRTVSSHGVNFVMDVFFQCMQVKYLSSRAAAVAREGAPPQGNRDDDVCEDELLEQFNES